MMINRRHLKLCAGHDDRFSSVHVGAFTRIAVSYVKYYVEIIKKIKKNLLVNSN